MLRLKKIRKNSYKNDRTVNENENFNTKCTIVKVELSPSKKNALFVLVKTFLK